MGTADLPDGVSSGDTGHVQWHEDLHDFLAGRVAATADLDLGTRKVTGDGTVPPGGSSANVLTKQSGTDYDVAWSPPAGGLTVGGTPQVGYVPKATVGGGDGSPTWQPDDTGSGTVPASGAKGHILVGNGSGGWVSKIHWHPEMHLVSPSAYGGLTKAGGAIGTPGFPYSNPVEAYEDFQDRTDNDPSPGYTHSWGSIVFMPGVYDLQYKAGVSNSRAIIPVGANIDFRAFHTSGGYGQGDSTQPKVHVRRADVAANNGLALFGYVDNFDTPHNEWHAWITFEGINFVGLNGRNSPYFTTAGTTATNTTSEAPLFDWWNTGANMIYRDCAFNDNYGYWIRVRQSIENLWLQNVFGNVITGGVHITGWSTGGTLDISQVQIDNFQRFVFLDNLPGAISNLRAVRITASSFEGRTGAADGDWEHIVYRTTDDTGLGASVGRVMSVAIRDCTMFQQDAGNIAFEALFEEVDTGDGSAWPARVYINNSPYRDDVYSGFPYKSNLSNKTPVGRGDDLFFDGAALWETHNGAKYKNGVSYA